MEIIHIIVTVALVGVASFAIVLPFFMRSIP